MGVGGKLLPLPWNALTTVSEPAITGGTVAETYFVLINDFYRPYIARHNGATTR